jgi:hypothetical protein
MGAAASKKKGEGAAAALLASLLCAVGASKCTNTRLKALLLAPLNDIDKRTSTSNQPADRG